MICTNCKKIKTNNGNGICGFCLLRDSLASYVNADKIRQAVLNIPTDHKIDKVSFIEDSDRTARDYADERNI